MKTTLELQLQKWTYSNELWITCSRIDRKKQVQEIPAQKLGYTCCVPGCYSYFKTEKNLVLQ